MFNIHRRRGFTARCLVATGLVGSTLVGVTPSIGASSHSVVNVVMWQQWGGGNDQRVLDKFIALFNSTHPTIHVTELDVEDNTKIVAAIAGGQPPDLMDLGTTGTIGQWAEQGLLQPLDGLIKSSKLDMSAFYPAGWNAVTYKGQHWGVPFMNFNNGLLYNVAEFQQAGITHAPRTLEELNADAAKLTIVKNGQIQRLGFVPDYPYGSWLLNYAWLFGGDWFNGTKSIAADAANIQALNWEAGFYSKYGADAVARFQSGLGAADTAQDGFESGKIAMMYDGEWVLKYAQDNVPNLRIGAAPFPAPAGHANRNGTSYIDTNPQVIPAGAAHPNEAFEFIKWEATNPQFVSQFASLTWNLPHLKNVPQTAVLKNPLFQVFIKIANGPATKQLPQTAVSAQFNTNLGNAEHSVLLGKSSASQALQALQKTTQQELDSAH